MAAAHVAVLTGAGLRHMRGAGMRNAIPIAPVVDDKLLVLLVLGFIIKPSSNGKRSARRKQATVHPFDGRRYRYVEISGCARIRVTWGRTGFVGTVPVV